MNGLRPGLPCGAAALLLLFAADPTAAGKPKLPAEPAKIRIAVQPATVSPGGAARVSLQLEPIDGVKINRYPKIKLQVPEQRGLVRGNEAAVGNPAPPPPDRLGKNYFEEVEPVELVLEVDAAAPAGRHKIEGKLSYAYCVIASGFCAPVRVPVTIPVEVR